MAKHKITDYNPEKKEDDSEWQGEQIGWYYMVTKYADAGDVCLLYLGIFGSVAFGAAMPAFCYYFGTMIDGVAGVQADAGSGGGMMNLSEQSFMMLYVGVASLFVSWF